MFKEIGKTRNSMMKAKKWNFQITACNFGKDLKLPQMCTKTALHS